ncbi:MAG TPA: hypothetical protein VFH30_00775 [Acidimicrobiales bacterium]|nr:hypothetical protein [Acidimicrobiales bacterium]
MDNPPLAELVGQELDTVSFVRDYLELRIDYSILRALRAVTGSIDGLSWQLGDNGAADLLLRYIGRTVMAVEVVEHERISLAFGAEDWIDVSLREQDRVGPEAAHFVPAREDGRLDVAAMWIW